MGQHLRHFLPLPTSFRQINESMYDRINKKQLKPDSSLKYGQLASLVWGICSHRVLCPQEGAHLAQDCCCPWTSVPTISVCTGSHRLCSWSLLLDYLNQYAWCFRITFIYSRDFYSYFMCIFRILSHFIFSCFERTVFINSIEDGQCQLCQRLNPQPWGT